MAGHNKKDDRYFEEDQLYTSDVPLITEDEIPKSFSRRLVDALAMLCSRDTWLKASVMHIFISFFLNMLANSFANVTLPLVLIDLCRGDVSEAAALQAYLGAASSGATLVTAALLGLISDRWGRRSVLLLSLLGYGVDIGAIAAVHTFRWDVWPLYFTRAIGGATSGYYTAGYAYMADISDPENRSKNFGAFGVGMGLAFMIGPLVGGVLGERDLSYPLICGVIVTVVNMAYVLFIMVESKSKERKPWDWARINPFRSFTMLLDNSYALCIALTYLVNFLAEEGVISISMLYIKYKFGWGALEFGITTAYFGITYCLSQGVLLRFVLPRVGDRKCLFIALFVDAVGNWVWAVIPNGYWVFPLMLFRTIPLMAMPVSQGIISKQYGKEQQGELMGVLAGLKTITAFVGPLMYSSLFSYFTSDNAWPSQDGGNVYYVITLNAMVACIALGITYRVFPASMTEDKAKPTVMMGAEDEESAMLLNSEELHLVGRDSSYSLIKKQ